MIHYDLRCAKDHAFDGWFRDSAAFEAQAEGGLLACPVCGDERVSRALMAPAVAKRRRRAKVAEEQTAAPATAAGPATAVVPQPAATQMPAQLPAQLRAVLQRMRAEVERHCDYVGQDFADEARRIHRGEIEARGIYGETSPEQAESLAEEGIEVSRIPWVDRADG